MKDQINFFRLALKSLLIVLIIGAVLLPIAGNSIGKLTLYNWFLPGRERFPFSDTPSKAYNLSLFNLDAMFASHQLTSKNKPDQQFRVFLLGDSSTWGTLLKPEDTLAGQLNQMGLTGPDGKSLEFYNLGYPTLSLSKDLLLLDKALVYEPDMIIWLFTLESFPADKQLTSPLVENNPQAVTILLETYNLEPSIYGADVQVYPYWDATLFKQRRNLADILRLQLYGVMWGITGIDQYYPPEYESAARDLADDLTFHGWQEGEMTRDNLALEVLTAGTGATGEVPIIFVNEPILISSGMNSDLRYNFYYPRWAYDQYRDILDTFSTDQDLIYLDYWDLIPAEEFTNTAIHATPYGVSLLAADLATQIQRVLNP